MRFFVTIGIFIEILTIALLLKPIATQETWNLTRFHPAEESCPVADFVLGKSENPLNLVINVNSAISATIQNLLLTSLEFHLNEDGIEFEVGPASQVTVKSLVGKFRINVKEFHLKVGFLKKKSNDVPINQTENSSEIKKLNSLCFPEDAAVEQCSIKLSSSSPIYSLVVSTIQGVLQSELCGDAGYLSKLVEAIRNGSYIDDPKPIEYEFNATQMTDMTESPMVQMISNILDVVPPINTGNNITLDINFWALTKSSLTSKVLFPNGLALSLTKDFSLPKLPSLISILEVIMPGVGKDITNTVVSNYNKISVVANKFAFERFYLNNMAYFGAGMHMRARNFNCPSDPFVCFIPRHGAFEVERIWFPGNGVLTLFCESLSAPLANLLNANLLHVDGKVSDETICLKMDNWNPLFFPTTPFLLKTMLPAFFTYVVFFVYSVIHHYLWPDFDPIAQKPISMRRVIIEDSILCLLSYTSMFLFVISNITIGASIFLGQSLRLNIIVLMKTITEIHEGGFHTLANFIFFETAIYPYIKLLLLTIIPLIFRRPRLFVVRIIDILGKFSLFDVLILILLMNGLVVPGIIDVEFHLGMYCLVISSLLSMLLGGYVNVIWRKGTQIDVLALANQLNFKAPWVKNTTTVFTEAFDSINYDRAIGKSNSRVSPKGSFSEDFLKGKDIFSSSELKSQKDRSILDFSNSGSKQTKLFDVSVSKEASIVMNIVPENPFILPPDVIRTAKENMEGNHFFYWYLNIPLCILFVISTIIYWFVPIVYYKQNPVFVFLNRGEKKLSTFDIYKVSNPVLLVLIFLVTFVFPIAYSLMFSKVPLLAGWCAIDVMFTAYLIGVNKMWEISESIIGEPLGSKLATAGVFYWPIWVLGASVTLYWIIVVLMELPIQLLPRKTKHEGKSSKTITPEIFLVDQHFPPKNSYLLPSNQNTHS